MDKRKLHIIMKEFDNAVNTTEENIEYWYARELMELLGYSRWENFEKAIKRAVESC